MLLVNSSQNIVHQSTWQGRGTGNHYLILYKKMWLWDVSTNSYSSSVNEPRCIPRQPERWVWGGIPLGYTTPPLNRYAVVVSATLQWFIFLKDCILIHLTVIHVDYRWWKLSLLKSELLSHLDHAEGDENLSRVGHSGDQRITCLEDSHQLSSAEEEMWEMLLQIPPSLEM